MGEAPFQTIHMLILLCSHGCAICSNNTSPGFREGFVESTLQELRAIMSTGLRSQRCFLPVILGAGNYQLHNHKLHQRTLHNHTVYDGVLLRNTYEGN